MKQIVDWFQNHPELSVLATIAGLVGFPLGLWGLYIAIVSRKKNKLCFAASGNNLITGYVSKFSNLKISFNDNPVKTLSVSKILIWNGGNETIRRDDISDVSPLVISSHEDIFIYESSVIEFSEMANSVEIAQIDSQNIKIGFDYLDPGDGFVIQVIHSGESFAVLAISGKVKGVKNIRQLSLWRGKMYLPLMVVFFCLLFISTLLFSLLSPKVDSKSNTAWSYFEFVMFAVIIGSSFLATNKKMNSFVSNIFYRLPKWYKFDY